MNFNNFEEQDSTDRIINCMEFILLSLLSVAVSTKCRSFRDVGFMGCCPTAELIEAIYKHHGNDGAECTAVALAVLETEDYINIRESIILNGAKLASITEEGVDNICKMVGKNNEFNELKRDVDSMGHNIKKQHDRLITVQAKPHGGPK